MSNTIQPLSSPDEIRAAQEAEVAARASQPMVLEQGPASPATYPVPTTGKLKPDSTAQQDINIAAAQAIVSQKQKPLRGLYVVIALLLLSGISNILTDPGQLIYIISGVISFLLAFGLLRRSEIARMILVIIIGLNVALGTLGLFNPSGGRSAYGLAFAINGLIFIAQVGMLIYLTRPHVKFHFAN